MKLVARAPHPRNPEWRVLTIEQDGKQQAVLCFAGRAADALPLGEELPQGATVEPPKFESGLPSVRLPSARPGGGGAWRNSREGATWEDQARTRRLELEQERMDRRTALMQAVALVGSGADTDVVMAAADVLYGWLRRSSGSAVGGGEAPRPVPTPTSPAEVPPPSGDATISASVGDPTSDDLCHCGAPWGPARTAHGRRLCTRGHVER